MTDIGKALMKMLKEIYNDHDFVCGVMSNCGGEEAWKELYNYISFSNEHKEVVTSDDILALSLALGTRKENGASKAKKQNGIMVATL